jgi:HEPN domain-containing protein
MSLEQQKVAECWAWLGCAWADLDSVSILLGADRPRLDTALFHRQQAAEKAWKVFLFGNDVPFRKTRNLRELGEACTRVNGSLASLAERAEDLTQFAWVFYYPGKMEKLPREEAESALALAQEVYAAVLSQLPAEVRP